MGEKVRRGAAGASEAGGGVKLTYNPKSDLGDLFDGVCRVLDVPPYSMEREYQFDPARRWRFDRANRLAKVAVELEGGIWNGGRHIQPKGFEADVEKYNRATFLGWAVFRLTHEMMVADPSRHILPIFDAIKIRIRDGLGE